MKKVGILYDNISGNIGDQAIGITVRRLLAEVGVDYEELVPGRFNPADYRTIVIGGGYLLQPGPNFFYDKFRVPGKHILNCCGIVGSPDDLNYLDDYSYVTVRSNGDKRKLSYLEREVGVVPCTAMLLKDLPQFDLRIQKPCIGVHVWGGIIDEEALVEYLSRQPFHVCFLPVTHYNRDFTYLEKLSQKVENSTLLPILRPEEIFTVIGKFDYFICTSLHGAIFAYVHNVPFLLYDSQDKQRFFMEDRKLDSYLFRSFDELQAGFEELQNSRPDYSAALANDSRVLQEHKLKIRDILHKQLMGVGAEPVITKRESQAKELQAILQERDFQVHYLQNQVEALAAQVSHRINQISSLEASLREKVIQIHRLESQIYSLESQIHTLESQIDQIQHSIPMQLVDRYQRIIEKLLRPGTRRRHYYGLGLTGIRVILNEGWRSFFRKAWGRLTRRPTPIRGSRHDLPKFNASISIKEAEELTFPVPSEKPDVSIVIPAYNKWRYTLNCLKSIVENTNGDYEALVIDDSSTDETATVLAGVKNLRLIVNEQNEGFVESCNGGARASKGKYILFLNNDTMVTKGWLPPLLELMKREDVGAVGSKLVYRDGTLQEAGSIVWRDGSALGYGRGDDSGKPEYNYVREVDYCSGAGLMVKAELFERIGGFDERFKPAYYEDADLCFAVRELGYSVMYQPMSVIVHLEGVTCGTDIYDGIKKYQEINKPKFVGKWKTVLDKHDYYESHKNVLSSRNRLAGKSILILDDRIPNPGQGSGFPRAYRLLKYVAELGYRVTFFPLDNATPWQPCTNELQQSGIEVFYGGKLNFTRFTEHRDGFYDTVLVSRPHNMQKTSDLIRAFFPGAALLYDAEAIFSVRDILKARVRGDERMEKVAQGMMNQELNLVGKADLIITVSENERKVIAEKTGSNNVTVWGHPVEVKEPHTPFAQRKDILFVGGFLGLDSPNEDAIVYFAEEVFPKVEPELSCRLFIVGMNPPDSVRKLSSSSVIVTGYVEDLGEYYEKCRLFVVPHRYSAGIPLKLLEAMGHGVPSIVSKLTASQLDLTDSKEVLVADTSEEFAEKIMELYQDEKLWHRVQHHALNLVREKCAPENMKAVLSEIILRALQTKGGQ